MADKNRVADKSTMHRYRIELPILIDDLDLSVYEFRLYVRFKRRSGDGGSCYEGARSLAKACGMSAGQVAKAKKGLEEKGLIRIGTKQTRGGQTDDVMLIDIWPRNFRAYADDESDHHTITSEKAITTRSLSSGSDHQVIASGESDHTANTLTSKRSPGDRKNHDQYHIGVITNTPTPTTRETKNGVGDDDDDYFHQLRKRGIGQKKAQEIVTRRPDQDRVLQILDTRPPEARDPASQAFGKLLLDILDGVAAMPAPRATTNGTPPPPAPRAVLTADDRRALAEQYDPFKKANAHDTPS